MRILICTQAVDKQDPVLGFLHIWIEELASHFASITVICLRKGQYDFPENVEVLSLGKENGTSRPARIFRFFRFVFSKRHNYESVLVHMNQEYILLGGWIWWILQKRIYLWRNHYAGTLLTDIAALFCTRVFCTSKFSYTAKYRKTVLMPVGVNTQLFRRIPDVERDGRKLLFLGRMAPSKKPDLLIGALEIVRHRHLPFSAALYGPPSEQDMGYHDALKQKIRQLGLVNAVQFYNGIPNIETPRIYKEHAIFVNCSASGMLDKTIFEAMACESLVLASSRDLAEIAGESFTFPENNREVLAKKIETFSRLQKTERENMGAKLRDLVEKEHSLVMLGRKIAQEMGA